MTNTSVTLNNEQKLYVIPSGDGFSCWGFQNCFDEVTLLADMLMGERPERPTMEHDFGTLSLYHAHRTLLDKANQLGKLNRTWFSLNTPQQVREILETARLNPDGQRLRLYYGDVKTGRSWMDEHDMVGYIGRSMGMLKVPLLMETKRSGGGAILTDCIVRIIDTASKRDLYRHPTFNMPALFRRPVTDESALDAGYTDEVTADGAVHARFKSAKKANDWIDFMEGRRMRT